MNWHHSSKVTKWKRGDATEDLVEISDEEAHLLIEQFRQRWEASFA
jgi:hypothetical protein